MRALGISVSWVVVFIVSFQVNDAASEEGEDKSTRTLGFAWCPPGGDAASYRMTEVSDRHQIVFLPGVKKTGTYPVVVGFHGQPRRGKPPREYRFAREVVRTAEELVNAGKVKPFVLVLPVFRYRGENWPLFDTKEFRREVLTRLRKEGVISSDWYAFGHSGAAGCGGLGLNDVAAMSPRAVGYFDTCLGKGWQKAMATLRKRNIQTVNIHTVETAGFRPRQRPEYQSWFDFARAYAPVGMRPTPCPVHTPGKKLRDQKYKCAATPDGIIRGFVVDAGEGVDAHRAIVSIGLRYLLKEYLGVR